MVCLTPTRDSLAAIHAVRAWMGLHVSVPPWREHFQEPVLHSLVESRLKTYVNSVLVNAQVGPQQSP